MYTRIRLRRRGYPHVKHGSSQLVENDENIHLIKKEIKPQGFDHEKGGPSQLVENDENNPLIKKEIKPQGFDRKLPPEKILGATDKTGKLQYLMKWKGLDKPELVCSVKAKQVCPQLIIKFYESRLIWSNSDEPVKVG